MLMYVNKQLTFNSIDIIESEMYYVIWELVRSCWIGSNAIEILYILKSYIFWDIFLCSSVIIYWCSKEKSASILRIKE
jgi:hypothetical protein